MIREANQSDYPALINIWEVCFGDCHEFIQNFLDNNFESCRTICYCIDNVPVSVCYLIPSHHIAEGVVSSAYYLYAAATLPLYQGRGYFGEILAWIESNISDGFFLVPADEKLSIYYKKHGLSQIQASSEINCDYDSGLSCDNPCIFNALNDEAFYNVRSNILSQQYKPGYIAFERQLIAYIVRDTLSDEGFCLSAGLDSSLYSVLGRKHSDSLYIHELLPLDCNCNIILNELMRINNVHKAHLCITPTVMASGKCARTLRDSYFNLYMG